MRTCVPPSSFSNDPLPLYTPEKLPDPLALTTVTATLATPIVKALGVPAVRHESVILLPVGGFMVSTNCSGLSTFYAAVFLAVLLAAHARTRTRKVILLLSPWPATVAVNAIRTAFLVALCQRSGPQIADTPIHGLSGIGTFSAAMLLIFLLAGRPRLWKMNP